MRSRTSLQTIICKRIFGIIFHVVDKVHKGTESAENEGMLGQDEVEVEFAGSISK